MLKKIVVITHLEQLCTLLIQNTEDIMRSARRIGFDNGLGQPRSGQKPCKSGGPLGLSDFVLQSIQLYYFTPGPGVFVWFSTVSRL